MSRVLYHPTPPVTASLHVRFQFHVFALALFSFRRSFLVHCQLSWFRVLPLFEPESLNVCLQATKRWAAALGIWGVGAGTAALLVCPHLLVNLPTSTSHPGSSSR